MIRTNNSTIGKYDIVFSNQSNSEINPTMKQTFDNITQNGFYMFRNTVQDFIDGKMINNIQKQIFTADEEEILCDQLTIGEWLMVNTNNKKYFDVFEYIKRYTDIFGNHPSYTQPNLFDNIIKVDAENMFTVKQEILLNTIVVFFHYSNGLCYQLEIDDSCLVCFSCTASST